jgi:hypothetical protein
LDFCFFDFYVSFGLNIVLILQVTSAKVLTTLLGIKVEKFMQLLSQMCDENKKRDTKIKKQTNI